MQEMGLLYITHLFPLTVGRMKKTNLDYKQH